MESTHSFQSISTVRHTILHAHRQTHIEWHKLNIPISQRMLKKIVHYILKLTRLYKWATEFGKKGVNRDINSKSAMIKITCRCAFSQSWTFFMNCQWYCLFQLNNCECDLCKPQKAQSWHSKPKCVFVIDICWLNFGLGQWFLFGNFGFYDRKICPISWLIVLLFLSILFMASECCCHCSNISFNFSRSAVPWTHQKWFWIVRTMIFFTKSVLDYENVYICFGAPACTPIFLFLFFVYTSFYLWLSVPQITLSFSHFSRRCRRRERKSTHTIYEVYFCY